jgi:hypothetical protein
VRARGLTNLEPYLLIERGNLLGGAQMRAFLTLRLHGNMTVDLSMGGQVTVMLGRDASRRRRLRVCHYCVSMVAWWKEPVVGSCFARAAIEVHTRHQTRRSETKTQD